MSLYGEIAKRLGISRNTVRRYLRSGTIEPTYSRAAGPTVHDLRRTGSTLLNKLGFNRDWIEKCLAHEDGRSSRSIYNKAEYAEQRRHMLQEWANVVGAWIDGFTGSLGNAAEQGGG